MTRKLLTAAALTLFAAAAPLGFAGSANAKGHGHAGHASASHAGSHSHGGKSHSSVAGKSGKGGSHGSRSGGSSSGNNGFDTARTIFGLVGGMMARQ